MADELQPGQRVRWNKYRDQRDGGWIYGTVLSKVPKPVHNANIYILLDIKGHKVQKTFESLQVLGGVIA